jgi:xanthine/CO dehydrogenase XdhC/CoxF family maturation factor
MKNVYLQFANECQNIASPVLATILEPQVLLSKAGSSALFSASGLFAGTIGGGILEGKVMEIAIKAGKTKKSGFYSFLLDNSLATERMLVAGAEPMFWLMQILVIIQLHLNACKILWTMGFQALWLQE